jgi:hypothetical protein
LDALNGGGWGGGIYSLQQLPNHWLTSLLMGTLDSPVAHRTATIHCTVGAMSVCPLGFGAVFRWNPLSFCSTGQSGATPDMSGDL